MNLYLRYFDRETLVPTVDDAINFLAAIEEIGMDQQLEQDIRNYANSEQMYPKRYKVRPRIYFIIIKTEAANMHDFKEKKAAHSALLQTGGKGQQAIVKLNEYRPGWYEGALDFKRVLMVPGTGKFQYRDTQFVANVKADSAQDCYNRIVEHLKEQVDPRSQFPSAKGKNFKFRFLGRAKS